MSTSSITLLAVSASEKLSVGYGTLAALVLFILASMWIGLLANKAMASTGFAKGFFLGNRGLGAWALALTATVQSGGTFMGFPSLVYTHGWSVALWICGYMVVPITGFGVLGKRLAQLSRKTGAITVPDLFRARFKSPALGLTASLLIMFYMSFMMVAQFKAGALVMKLAWPSGGSLALAEDADAYRFDKASLSGLVAGGVPANVVDQLLPLADETFETEGNLKARLGELLAADEVTSYSGKIVEAAQPTDWLYLIGLVVFTLTVVGYTLLGGFLAAVWTDLFQSIMMLIGVMILLVLALNMSGGIEAATLKAAASTGPGFVYGPGYDPKGTGREFMPLGLAFSFFWVWVFAGVGSPAGMVRVMAGKSTEVIRKSIYLLSGYNALIYMPLVVICICGRAIIPDLDKTDEIIPRVALLTTQTLPGGSFLAGLILAAPFGAVMATVSSYLVVIASGLVRDVYQRFINPQAGTHDLRRLSYLAMIAIGAIAILANIKPVAYLQAIVVFSGTGAAATFCVPALMLAYWRRATVPGMLAAMFAGAGTMVVLYGLGFAEGFGFELLPKQNIGPVTRFHP
jgi:SSS family solute:Na+ symporter/sodium/pantothenate symporter